MKGTSTQSLDDKKKDWMGNKYIVFQSKKNGGFLKINEAQDLYQEICKYAEKNGCKDFGLKESYVLIPSPLSPAKKYELPEKGGNVSFSHGRVPWSHKHHVTITASNKKIGEELKRLIDEFLE